MPKEKRLELNHLLDNEVTALVCTNVHQVPRVTRFFGQGISASGDRCLILEYAHPLANVLHSYYP